MSRKKKNRFKSLIAQLHLWLGLISGIIVFIVAVTGCIFVFHDEIQDLTRDWRKISAQDKSFVSPSVLQEKAKQLYPGASANMIVYLNADRPAHVYTLIDDTPYHLYFDPYSAELIHVQNLEKEFFLIVEDLHKHLWLPEEIGKQVVGISTIIFILMLISGIILWWPKKSKNLSANFKVKWKARWRRLNYDWHKATGIWISLPALCIALFGLNFSYEWMHEALYSIGNVGREYQEEESIPEIEEITYEQTTVLAVDQAFRKTQEIMPKSGMYFVWEQGEEAPIITGAYPEALDFDGQSNFYFHPQTGDLLGEHPYAGKSPGLKLQEISYGLHTGQYFDLTGKIIAFFCSLFVAGLPVSGFMIWWGRKNKKKRQVNTWGRN